MVANNTKANGTPTVQEVASEHDRMGKEMRVSSIIAQKKVDPSYQGSQESPARLGVCGSERMEGCKGESSSTVAEYMGEEVHFSCAEFAAAFRDSRSESVKRLIAAFYKTRSRAACIRELGRKCNEATISREITRAAKRLGASSVNDLFMPGEIQDESTTKNDLMELIARQNYRCRLSGMRLTPNEASLDHITPVSDGGDHEIANLQWVHRDVNKMKGTMTQERFIDLCRMVAETYR